MWALLAPALAVAGAVIGMTANTNASNTAVSSIAAGENAAINTITAGNTTAENTVATAATGAVNTILSGTNTAVQQLEQGQSTADQVYQTYAANEAAQNAAGPQYLQKVVATSDQLTPAQAEQLNLSRQSLDNQLHGSDFAGSGQTAAALFKSSENDFTNTALQNNRQNAIQAATALNSNANSAATTAATGEASTATGTASSIANTISSGSNAVANVTTNAGNTIGGIQSNTANTEGTIQNTASTSEGQIEANAGLADANLTGQAIGTIGSSIAQANKAAPSGNVVVNVPSTSTTNLNNVNAG
jgi:hypothetical protein